MLKKGDIAIISAVLVLAAACSLFFIFGPAKKGKTVVVRADNKIVYDGALNHDHTVSLAGNVIKIAHNSVQMQSANCKNQICVHHKRISKAGESIICLPNKVIVEIE